MGGLVWLASYPKSGNTWTRNFLHNVLRGDGEGSFDINKMNTLTTWDSGMQWYKPLLDKPLEDCTKEEVAAVRIQANQRMADATPDLVFVKTHNAMGSSLLLEGMKRGAQAWWVFHELCDREMRKQMAAFPSQ